MADNDLILYTTDDGDARFVLRELSETSVVNFTFTTAQANSR